MTSAGVLGDGRVTALVEYRVLGPLTAFSDETRLGLGGRRQRMVLAVLLANVNRVISQDALIDAVWEGVVPESGAGSLHSYVSLLRKVLGGEIERVGDGYLLNVEPERLDVLQFEALLAEGRALAQVHPVKAADALRRGLGLWTGMPYGDLGHEPALRAEALRLAKERIAALELRFEVDLELGRHDQIIPEVEALLGEEPYREHLAGMLMTALYRSGRQAEALRVFAEMRERLVDELGIDPGQVLQDLELKILERDPSLAAPTVEIDLTTEVHGARGYEIHEPMGSTGFGERFRGFHGTMAREVSVLVVDTEVANDRQFVRGFEAEMQTVAQLEHPHLAPVLDYWRDPDHAYVITPFYRGGTLEDAIADGPLTVSAGIRLADQLSAGLGSLHRHDHRHGAITVASVLLDEEQNAYLADVGLAEAGGRTEMAVADDVYQLGALIYEVLTLRRPDEVYGPERLRGDLPDGMGHAISRALHPQPELRYQRIEDFARALRQSAGLDVMGSPRETVEIERRNPYKGLRAFQESDAADFHGRDALIEEMVEALTGSRLVAVVGPSGSGKSSAVRAGLLPRLRQGVVPGSAEWLITDMFPGSHPFETLAAALLRVASFRPPGLYETLTADPRGLAMIVDQLLGGAGSELLLVVDQFEELFSLANSPPDRQSFLDSLIAASERSRLRVVLTLRADFFDQPLEYPEFAELFRSNVVAVSPPTRDGLARAISQPALGVGVGLEPGLATQMVDDVREQPGGLPLLQFALTDLFARREGDVLTLAAYEQSGGVGGALAMRAEETYASLTPQGKEAARQLFLRLVTVDELADDTRRRVRQSELRGLDLDHQVMNQVLQQFGALRFLSFDRDPASRAPTVELAHEALLREWQRLKTWIDERREDLLIHRRIQMTVQDWRESRDDQSYLLRGGRLEQALNWQERTDIAITDEEMTLIEASIEAEQQELAEREALEAKASRRRKAVIGVLAGGLVVAGVLGAVALERAEDARVIAARATARDLSNAAMDAISDDPELGVLLSLEAIAATDAVGVPEVPEAASALRNSLSETRIVERLPTGLQAVAYNGDGSRIVADDAEDPSRLHLWDTTKRELAEWVTSEDPDFLPGEITRVAFSPDDELVAATWLAPGQIPLLETPRLNVEPAAAESMVAVSVHDADTLDLVLKLVGDPGVYWYPSFGADGMISAVNVASGVLYVWDLASGQLLTTIAFDEVQSEFALPGAHFVPGTTHVVMIHDAFREEDTGNLVRNGRLELIDVPSGQVIDSGLELGIGPDVSALSPDGSKVVVAELDVGKVEIWSIHSQTRLASFLAPDPQGLSWSPDGTRLALSGNDADITIVDERNGWEPVLVLTGPKSPVWSIAFSPNGDRLASATNDGDVVIWDVTETGAVGDRAIAVGGPVGLFFLGPNDRLIAGIDGIGVQTIDLNTGAVEATVPDSDDFDLSPNDRFTTVAVMHESPDSITGFLVDAGTGEVTESFSECLVPRAVSFDDRHVVLDSTIAGCAGTEPPSQVFDVQRNEILVDLGKRLAFKAVFSPEGFDGPPYVAVNAGWGSVEIYSLDDGELVASYSTEEFGISGFLVLSTDPEGRYLGIGTDGPYSIALDMDDLMSGIPSDEAVLFSVLSNKERAPQFRVTADGIAASASFDPVYRVWDITTGEFLFEVHVDGLGGELGAVNFTWDGTQMAYEDGNGVIRFTPLDTNEVVARAEATVTRTLTDDECSRYLHTDGCLDE